MLVSGMWLPVWYCCVNFWCEEQQEQIDRLTCQVRPQVVSHWVVRVARLERCCWKVEELREQQKRHQAWERTSVQGLDLAIEPGDFGFGPRFFILKMESEEDKRAHVRISICPFSISTFFMFFSLACFCPFRACLFSLQGCGSSAIGPPLSSISSFSSFIALAAHLTHVTRWRFCHMSCMERPANLAGWKVSACQNLLGCIFSFHRCQSCCS